MIPSNVPLQGEVSSNGLVRGELHVPVRLPRIPQAAVDFPIPDNATYAP